MTDKVAVELGYLEYTNPPCAPITDLSRGETTIGLREFQYLLMQCLADCIEVLGSHPDTEAGPPVMVL